MGMGSKALVEEKKIEGTIRFPCNSSACASLFQRILPNMVIVCGQHEGSKGSFDDFT